MLQLEHYRALREGAGLVDRSGRGKIVVAGQDRRTYLHAMLTNDIAALRPGTGCYAAYLTPQGRMIADMCVYELGDVCLMDVHPSVKDAVIARLDQFVFSEDVRLGDVTETFGRIGVYGPRSAEAIAAAFPFDGSAPALSAERLAGLQPFENMRVPFAREPVVVVADSRSGERGFELYCDRRACDGMRQALLQAGSVPVSDDAVETVRIEAGVPEFPVDMDQQTIPLEAGIEKQAISFTKGCYPGQEVVIRILHRGHGRVAKKLVGLLVKDDATATAGDAVLAGEQEVGRITSATWSPSLMSPVALGYVARELAEPGTAVSVARGDQRLAAVVAPLPFVASSW